MQSTIQENQQLKDMNQQLRELTDTYNNESRSRRIDFDKREAEFREREAELKKALIAQEKKTVDKVLESIEYRHQGFTKQAEFDLCGKMSQELDKFQNKKKELENNPIVNRADLLPSKSSSTEAKKDQPFAFNPAQIEHRLPEQSNPIRPTQIPQTIDQIKPTIPMPVKQEIVPTKPSPSKISEKIETEFFDEFEDF